MKTEWPVLTFAALLLAALPAPAQENSVSAAAESGLPAAGTPATPFEARDPFFHVMSDRGSDDAAQLIREMGLRFAFYSRFFRYEDGEVAFPLRVRAFSDSESYDAYVSGRLGGTRRGAVYLHYPDPSRRELVINRGSPEEQTAVPREAFLQYFRAHAANPPAWLREGFAIYFSSLRYDPVMGGIDYTENLSWLDQVKALENPAPPEQVLLADSLGTPGNFQQLAWSLVSFFVNTGREEYFRTLAEILMLIPGNATARENAQLVAAHISRWLDMDILKKDYGAYIASRRTFTDLVREGQRAFTDRDLVTAELNFQAALNQRPGNYSPYYYLGLISCEKKDYGAADSFYRLALDRGADRALVFWARGVNAVQAGLRDDAIGHFSSAAEANPAHYGDRARTVIAGLSTPPPAAAEMPAASAPSGPPAP